MNSSSLFSNSWQNIQGNERKRSQSLDTRISSQRDSTYQLFGSSFSGQTTTNTQYLYSNEQQIDIIPSLSPKDNSMYYENRQPSKKFDYPSNASRFDLFNSNVDSLPTRNRAHTIDVFPQGVELKNGESDDLIFNMDLDSNELRGDSKSRSILRSSVVLGQNTNTQNLQHSSIPSPIHSLQNSLGSSFTSIQTGNSNQIERSSLGFSSNSFGFNSFSSEKANYGTSPSHSFDIPYPSPLGSPHQIISNQGLSNSQNISGVFPPPMGSGYNSPTNTFSNVGGLSSSVHSNGSGSSLHGTSLLHSQLSRPSISTSQNQYNGLPSPILDSHVLSSSPKLGGIPNSPQSVIQNQNSWAEMTGVTIPNSSSPIYYSQTLSISPSSYPNSQSSESPPRSESFNTREHPAGEYPSRTLFVRNISCSVEDEELRKLFSQFGEIRNMYTSCKQRGFVMISYFDIRHAKAAMANLQHYTVQKRQIDVHYSIPKDNPSEKDANQGTLVVFNLDPSVTHDELMKYFGKYGEIKEIRETPHKTRHKFIEFFDVRHADLAMQSLNKTEIRGRKIKIEPSRPGGRPKNSQSESIGITIVSGVNSESTGSSPTSQAPSLTLSLSSFSSPVSTPLPIISHSFTTNSSNSNTQNSTPSSPMKTNSSTNGDQQTKGRTRSQDGNSRSKTKKDKEDEEKYKIIMDQVLKGNDKRTTLMIKNIPNKYNQKMLLTEIDKNFSGKYDFFYLPIDFKNKCNVGYAFINMVNPSAIVPFAKEFNLKKWGRFNSEKVCQLNYGRIQGKKNLVSHFQNSSLMDELVDCRPVFFDLEKKYYEQDYSNC